MHDDLIIWLPKGPNWRSVRLCLDFCNQSCPLLRVSCIHNTYPLGVNPLELSQAAGSGLPSEIESLLLGVRSENSPHFSGEMYLQLC